MWGNHLDLSRSRIDKEGAKALASNLRINTVLKTLDLECNAIGAEGAEALASALRVNGVLSPGLTA